MSHCWSPNVGWNRRKLIKNWKTQSQTRYFPGACSDNMYDYIKPLHWKLPDYIILHIGTKDALDNTSRKILEKIIKLKTYIRKELLKYKITISTPIKRHDRGKASLTISYLSKIFKDLSISIVYNSSIGAFPLRSGGLHLNSRLRKISYKSKAEDL